MTDHPMDHGVSAVIPVHDEEDNVEPLAKELLHVLDQVGRPHEVIFVDDGSTDNTVEALSGLRAITPLVRIVRHEKCCGQSTALLTGIRHARFQTIVTLDGDGQNDPTDVPQLLKSLDDLNRKDPGGMVIGHRHRRQDSFIRRLSSRTANAIRGRLLKDQTPDTGCGLKAFSRDTFLALPYFDHMHRFLPALFQRMGGAVVSVEVNHRPRTRGVSKYGTLDRLRVGIVDLLGVIWLQKRSKIPLVHEDK